MNLSTLKPAAGSTKKVKRIGRGQGSGHGGTSTKGHKGQKAISGYNYKPGFEGGQMPLQRRVPKFGFTNLNRTEYNVINLDALQEFASTHGLTEINHEVLVNHGVISNSRKLVKVLGRGELSSRLNVKLNKFSASAKTAIENAGGSVTEI
ncbi:MAG: 50S ribosomal protein L15 [Bacteroidia bacterium]|nr:50S ribosomal protein L15 [Bacteroidia bacterium]